MAYENPESFTTSIGHIIPDLTIDARRNISENETVENFILIWLDKNINEISEEYRTSIYLLKHLINSIRLFSNPEEFFNFIQRIKDEKVFVIVSGFFGEQKAWEMESIPQIHSIYVYCSQRQVHERWAKNVRKVKGVYTNIRPICDALRRDLRQANNDLTPISILSSVNSNEFDQSFACSLLLKQILINCDSNETMKKELIDFSRFHYSENDFELNVINDYEKKNSNQITPIEWYTRECFISSMINRSLRLYDIEILNKINFFIQDLHHQIQDLHMKSIDEKKLTVYYEQRISNEQFEKIKMNINGFLSFNTFLLTTIDREPSFNFVKQFGNDSNSVPILFQIEIDRSNSSFPFISLDELDYYHDTDRHILFSLNATFRILNIQPSTDKVYQVDLILIDDNEDQLKNLTNSIQKQFRKSKGFNSLAQMLIKMNELDRAKNMFDILLKNTPDNDQKQLAYIYRRLGYIDQRMEHFESAHSHYKKSLDAQSSYLSKYDATLSPSYAGIGAIAEKLGNLDRALKYLQRAIDIGCRISGFDRTIIATYYNDIGRIFVKQDRSLEARKSFERALEFQQKSYLSKDDLLAEIYYNLSMIYEKSFLYKEAEEHALKAVDIAIRVFGQDHHLVKKCQHQHLKVIQKK